MTGLEQEHGLVFVTERDGTISDIGAKNWNAFAKQNGAPELQAERVIGRNLFDFIQGEQVRDQFHKVLDRISENPNWSWVLPYRCDSPERERAMCQSLRPIFSGDRCTGFIFHSVEQHSRRRPPIDLYDFKAIEKSAREDPTLPVVNMCSWCQRVRCPSVSGDDWLKAEDYYAAGGSSNVRLKHGICEECLETTIDPFLVLEAAVWPSRA